MRSDNYNRHMKIHKDLFNLSTEEMEDELKARHVQKLARDEKEEKRQQIVVTAAKLDVSVPEEIQGQDKTDEIEIPTDDVRDRCLKNYKLYLEKIELGGKVTEFIESGLIVYDSLCKTDKECFDLYQKQLKIDTSNIVLRVWQQEAMKLFDAPTERQVIWITDKIGGKGKSFFQKYVIGYFGLSRVAHMDLRIKHANACNVLKKLPLATIDIFLFNDTRSTFGEDLNMYRLLEDLKDGQATGSKYDNDNLRFKTPNTVMIFSNQYPDLKKLTKDRWFILHPNKDGLLDVTEKMKKTLSR